MMHVRSIAPRFAAVILPLLLLGACATSTKLVNVWHDPAYAAGPFKKVIVLGLGAEGATSRVFEDIFAAELKRRGVDAIAGHTVFPPDGQPTREVIEQTAKNVGADGFLVARLVKTDKETQYTPGYSPAVLPGGGHVLQQLLRLLQRGGDLFPAGGLPVRRGDDRDEPLGRAQRQDGVGRDDADIRARQREPGGAGFRQAHHRCARRAQADSGEALLTGRV